MTDEELDFRLLFEGSPDILLVLLPDPPRYTMVAATDARLAATHTTRETLGRGLFELFPDNPDDPAATGNTNLRASLDRVVATRAADTMAVQKYDIRGPDGTFQAKYWSPKNIPLLSKTGKLAYILHRVEDVTDLVLASEVGKELRDRTHQMEREVIARSRELADVNRSLRDANAKLGELDVAKTAFFSNVSHEFRTPLTLILALVERAQSEPEATLAGEDLAALHRNAVRLLGLVNSLLDFSRIESGRLAMSFAPVDLATLTAGLVGSFQSLLDDAGLGLVVECPPLPEPVYVDPSHWEKVVMNLVSNAFKFTFEGQIGVRLRWLGERVELRVDDTGTGIPAPELPRIFERFHRVAGARGRSFEGSGIGLSLVHELVRLHGGDVRVESEVGRGTSFVVAIPTGKAHLPPERLVDAAATGTGGAAAATVLEARQWLQAAPEPGILPAAGAGPPAASPGPTERGRLLVADDNADMREYLRRLLSAYWDVTVVPNGRAALAAALADPPDLVLSDVMMPELDGVALLNELRSDPRTSTVPVVLISARAGEEARLSGLETGADDYLVKPFAAREVLSRVRTHLEMGRVRRAAAETARALAQTRAELVRKLEEEHGALKDAYRELQHTQSQLVQSAKMASLGQLVAGIAHEVNNPLAFAIAHLETVERSLATVAASLEPQLAAAPVAAPWGRALARLRELRLGLSRIQELVLKLRTFSRLDEGEKKRIDIRESVESVLTILQHRLRGRIEVTTALGAPETVECYASLLNQALMNLVANAIDAVEGHGTIGIESGVREGWFELSVTDSGRGVPDDLRERIFEPFFTTKAVGEGTGLGLSITYSIAKKHGGTVELRPGARGGTVAVLRFPLGAA